MSRFTLDGIYTIVAGYPAGVVADQTAAIVPMPTPNQSASDSVDIAEKARLARDAVRASPEPEVRRSLQQQATQLLSCEDAVLVAHYYVDSDLQELAEDTGGCVADSLEMARFGVTHPAGTVIVAGVRFMGETAKILSPEKGCCWLNRQRSALWILAAPPTRSVHSATSIRNGLWSSMRIPACGSRHGRTGW